MSFRDSLGRKQRWSVISACSETSKGTAQNAHYKDHKEPEKPDIISHTNQSERTSINRLATTNKWEFC